LSREGLADLEGALAKRIEQVGPHVSTVAVVRTNLSVNGRN